MTNRQKYDEAFVKVFEVGADQLEDLEYQQIATWDSVGHMSLIAELEDAFGIMMEMDDIIDFSSYRVGIDILKKYDIGI